MKTREASTTSIEGSIAKTGELDICTIYDMGSSKSKQSEDDEGPVLPSAPELSVLRTCRQREEESQLGKLGAELIREFTKSSGPSYWEKMKSNATLVTVKSGTQEWKAAARHFQKTVSDKSIVKIERCQNTYLWRRYLSRKISMISKNKGEINERVLFHGTRSTPSSKICEGESASGFDPRLGNGYYGRGAYFADKAAYSTDSYSHLNSDGTRQIFLAKVLTGITKEYGTGKDTGLKRAPNLPSGHKFFPGLYDSVAGGPHSGGRVSSRMYVIYDVSQSYPMYLYSYK